MKKVAIIGASRDMSKYGNKSVRAHLKQAWQVYPVNPKEDEIEGLKCYHDINDIKEKLDRISFYVPPAIGIKLLEKIRDKDIQEIFINPGAESDELIARAEELDLKIIQACSIIDIGEKPDNFN